MPLRAIVTDLLNPVVWNLPGNAAAKFYRFSLTEYSSVLDLTLAANLTPSDDRASQYLRHLQDELKHTQIFYARAGKLRAERGQKPLPPPGPEYEKLFELLGEKRFLAFVHIGEKRGCLQFTSYARYFAARGDDHTSSIFTTVLKDETFHMNYTRALLVDLCGSEKAARRELAKAALWEGYRNWLRAGRTLTGRLFVLISLLAYPLLLPYKAIAALRPGKPATTGWAADAS